MKCSETALGDSVQDADLKYIDPSYMIRSVQTTTGDRILCKVLGQSAVHGAFAGYTGFTVGLVNTHYVFLPIPTIIQVSQQRPYPALTLLKRRPAADT